MFKNLIVLEITGADIPSAISYMAVSGVAMYNIKYINLLSARIIIQRKDYTFIKNTAVKMGLKIERISQKGIFKYAVRMRNRAVLFIGIFFLIYLTIWIPKHILFVSVEGNDRISAESILQQAELSGLYFGAERKALRSEQIKNNLIERIPNLAWVGVNTTGCNAVIRVRENKAFEIGTDMLQHSSIVAITDGIITSCTVVSGAPQCKPGDAVKKDQVLISGYQELGNVVNLTRSNGEIYAKTKKEYKILSPGLRRTGDLSQVQTKYSMTIGKKRINLSKYSGISYAGCDKIYSERFIVLPGGFVLPISFVCERFVQYKNTPDIVFRDAEHVVENADFYLMEHAVSGRIINRDIQVKNESLFCLLNISYNCVEMIGRERVEDYKFDYGKNN